MPSLVERQEMISPRTPLGGRELIELVFMCMRVVPERSERNNMNAITTPGFGGLQR
jgi:hypothetical protein